MIIWIVGISASGKTTIGTALWRQWQRVDPATVLVDGDEIRRVFSQISHPDPYSLDGRRANAERMTELCAWLDRQGMNAVCCILSIFEEMRRLNRTRFGKYFEVFVDTPLEIAMKRDRKNLYGPALRGERDNVVGVDLPFCTPRHADLIVDNSRDGTDADAIAASILERAGIRIPAVASRG